MRRNIKVDIIRGVAMLQVVLGHTVTGCTNDSQHSFLFNVIWSLQMPLFIIISGYVTKYSRPINDVISLWRFIRKRTMGYLFPWAVWTFFVRGLILNQHSLLDIKYLLWHMDAGYWFLTTIWSICMFFGVADYCTSKLNVTRLYAKIVAHCLFCGLGMIILALIGLKMGLNFLAIKLTLYYFPIYLLGYIYGQLEDRLANIRHYCNIRECVIIISAAIWVAALSRVYVFDCADSGLDILLRFTISIFGCIFVCGLISGIAQGHNKNTENANAAIPQGEKGGVAKFLAWCGINSLSIYLLHTLSIRCISFDIVPQFGSALAFLGITVNYVVGIAVTCIYIRLISKLNILNKLLFWK